MEFNYKCSECGGKLDLVTGSQFPGDTYEYYLCEECDSSFPKEVIENV